MQVRNTMCCGIDEMDGIDDEPELIIKELWAYVDYDSDRLVNMYFFTDAVEYGGGLRLEKFINKHNLGSVTMSEEVNNPNTDNMIALWVFIPDWDAIEEFCKPKVETE